ncbi:ABC transporter ATP-binding protein [Cytophagaceae bacterium ABcell3]|nr:ABC transporter ATP-binding protein [Cytophagaceae bacterium ABcell3]
MRKEQTTSKTATKQLLRALSYAKPQKRTVIGIITLTLLVAASGVAEPLIIKHIFDNLGTESQALTQVAMGIGGLLALSLLKETFSGLSNWLTWRTRINIHYGLLGATVERIHRLPLDAHRKEGVGSVMTKLERGIQGFITAISEIAFNVLPALAYLVMAIVIMIQLDWRMTILVLAFAPLPTIIAAYAAPSQTERERFLMNRWGKIYSRFNEVLSGIVTVRSFAMEDYEKKRFLQDVDEANDRVVKGVGFDSRIGAFQNIVVTMARISAIALGGYFVIKGEFQIGTLMAFLGYVGGLFGPVQGLTGIYKTTQTAKVSLEHIFNILDTQDHLGDAPNAIEPGPFKGEVKFSHIHFNYKGCEKLLNGINLHVKPGECVAIVGPSGSGKSTLMALLQRFYDPQEGTVEIDGMDVRTLKQQALRKQTGVVMQDALLFNDSIKNNIAYGRPNASDKEIIEAAIAANAHEFIMKMEDGYNTILGEKGNGLSVGERQRIAIARALLKSPPILILDEATSALDAELEAKVQEALDRLIKGRTTFIIAHRLATVVNADRIVVFKNGKIIETGTHKDLLNENGYYATLVERQTKGLLVA